MNDIFLRTRTLLGEERFEKLSQANVLVVGVGGVGGYVAELMVRSGIKAITVVDGDQVDPSNLNRQIIALQSTIGQPKVEAIRRRIAEINPDCKVNALHLRYNESTKKQILSKNFSFVADCIDSVADKADLILSCMERNLKVMSSLGAGNRFDIPQFCVKDIFAVSGDGLARALRIKLRKGGVTKYLCTAASSPAIKNSLVKSIAYYPSAAASVLTAYAVNAIIES